MILIQGLGGYGFTDVSTGFLITLFNQSCPKACQ
jgi:hypothetical protein